MVSQEDQLEEGATVRYYEEKSFVDSGHAPILAEVLDNDGEWTGE